VPSLLASVVTEASIIGVEASVPASVATPPSGLPGTHAELTQSKPGAQSVAAITQVFRHVPEPGSHVNAPQLATVGSRHWPVPLHNGAASCEPLPEHEALPHVVVAGA
jgi:hypothetical protein